MKRLTWLFLAVFCIAMVQVRPADAAKAKNCSCCHPGACGMPGCCPLPAPASPVFTSPQSARVTSMPARRKADSVRGFPEKFYACFVVPVAARPALFASAEAAPAVHVPLFKAHCSFLI